VTSTPATAVEELTRSEELLWRRFSAVLGTLPGVVDERIRAATGLNHFQYGVLDALSHQPDRRLQLTQIAKSSDASLSRLSHAITRLESAGLVTREICDFDRRANWAVLTDAGAVLVDESRAVYTQTIRETLLDRVPAEQHEALTALLTSLLPGEVAEQCDTLDADLTD